MWISLYQHILQKKINTIATYNLVVTRLLIHEHVILYMHENKITLSLSKGPFLDYVCQESHPQPPPVPRRMHGPEVTAPPPARVTRVPISAGSRADR